MNGLHKRIQRKIWGLLISKPFAAFSLLALLTVPLTVKGQETFIDNFNIVANNNNNGTQNWANNWIEYEPYQNGNNIGNGWVRITGGRYRFQYLYDEYAQRSADLSNYASASISFDWQTQSLEGGENLVVQISNNPNNGWFTLVTIGGNVSGSFFADITPYISTETTIRITNIGNFWSGTSDIAYIDNLTITAEPINMANFMRHGKFFNKAGEREMKF